MAALALSWGTVDSVDYLPLLFLALVLVGGAVVLRSMIRLKRAAVAALEAARELDVRLQSLKAQTANLPSPPPEDPPPS